MRFLRFIWTALFTALLAGSAVEAAEQPDPAQLEAIENELQSSQSRQTEIATDIDALAREAQSISDKLIAAAQRIQARETTIVAADGRVAALKKEEIVIRAALAEKQDVLSELLAGLQKLERNPPPALVVEPGDILSALRGAIMFGALVPELEAEAHALAERLERLDSIRRETAAEQDGIRDNIVKLAASQDELKDLQARKTALLATRKEALDAERARGRQLAAKAKDLKQLLAALEDDRVRREAEDATSSAAAEAESRRQAAIAARPRIALADAKGKLDYPAQGRLVKRYGDSDGFGGAVKGQFIETRREAQVVAPTDGKVEFAGAFRSYGQLLILNAGNGYHVLLAGMGGMTVETGQVVRAGEPLAKMGEAPAPGTLTGDQIHSTAPVLYIEFRKNGEAIDSTPWWIGGFQEAKG
jgi:murein hydrolase activator